MGRKELGIRLANQGQELVVRIAPAILGKVPDPEEGVIRAKGRA